MNSFDNIPQEMKELPQWVARVDKIPINPNSLYGAKSTDKTSWGTFEQAKAAIGKKAKMKAVQGKECNGIGFVLSAPYCGIDIDHCFNPETGEMFGGYTSLNERSAAADCIYRGYMQEDEQPESKPFKATTPTQSFTPLTDNEIIEKATRSKNGVEFSSLWRGDTSNYNGDESRADLALCNILAFWSGCDSSTIDRLFRQSGLMRDKWDRETGGTTYGKMTVQKAIQDCHETYSPNRKAETAIQDFSESIKYAPKWVYQGEDGKLKIDENDYITTFAEQQAVKCINGALYSVDGKMNDDKAKNIIFTEIKSYVRTNAGDKAEKLLKGIKQYCYTEPPKPTLDKIHFQNGTLSKDKNGLFTVWSDKKEFCINRLAVNYNPNAPIPKKFFDYLSAVYYEDDRKTIQQYCGYCLIPTTIIQKALLIIGDGGEGKSVLGAILNVLFGEENCYNESISVLQSKFGVANVENKLLFIDDDLSENALTNARTFKNLVTNKTTIAAEKKFVQNNQFKSYIRFLIFGNFTLQSLYDLSEGFSRRQLVLQAKPKAENRTDNPFIDREIVEEEGEGVMLWIINGLNELIKNNYKIFVSDRTQAKSEELKKQQDSVLCFLEECDRIVVAPSEKIFGCDLYQIYTDFCEENLLTTLKKNSFVSTLKQKGKKKGIKHSTNITIDGTRARGFEGIGKSPKADSYIFTRY